MSKTVAVIGASRDRRKFGNKALRAFQHQGYEVIPINPGQTFIEGLKCYPSVLAVPGSIDLATFYVPAEIGQQVIGEVAEKHIDEVWLNPGSGQTGARRARRSAGAPSDPPVQYYQNRRGSLRVLKSGEVTHDTV